MLSTRYQCIFIRISKVASTSIQEAFIRPKNSVEALKIRVLERGEFHTQHHDLAYYSRTYPKQFLNYFKFTFVRNPWDRIYSQYRYQRYNLKRQEAQCSFEDWLKKCQEAYHDPEGCLFGRDRYYFLRHLTNQTDWIKVDGKIIVDYVGRYENLSQDFQQLCSQKGWKISLPLVNETKAEKARYVEYYSNWSIELVANWHKEDLDGFGYEFGE